MHRIHIDISVLAKDLVGVSRWKYGAGMDEAPGFFDCSGLVKWLYARNGIWLPRRSTEQHAFCVARDCLVAREEIVPGDIIFTDSPYRNGVLADERGAIGHVSIVVGEGAVVSATNSELGKGVVRLDLEALFRTRRFIDAGRPCKLR